MNQTVNVITDNIIVDVLNNEPTINISTNTITLDVASGGIVPANVDTVLTAGVNISALRAITTDSSGKAKYATNTTAADAIVVGISITAANTGANVTIKTSGLITDNAFNFTKGIVYLGTNGQLTQTAPTSGAYIVPVAKAITQTTIIVDIDNSILTV